MLAIETATSVCSVALIDDGVVIDAGHLVVGRGHAERLLPMIAALDRGGRADRILVDIGPGSFTGVRVGVSAARALGFGWGAAVAGFFSLALIAALDGDDDPQIVIEGGHGEVFVGGRHIMPRSLAFDTAVATLIDERLVGNAAARIVAARGWGSAVALDPDARGVRLLPASSTALAPLPFYGRDADATPKA